MITTSQQRRISPRALVGKIFVFNGLIFIGVAVLLGVLSVPGLIFAQGTSLLVLKLLSLIFGGVGLLEALAGLVLWLLPGSSAPANVVTHYYAAFENQDYMTAFQYLYPYMRTPQGQTITTDWFTQRARAYDLEQGLVSNYALAQVKANPGIRMYTLKITRGSGSYKTCLRLQKQGFDWKIMSFDRF